MKTAFGRSFGVLTLALALVAGLGRSAGAQDGTPAAGEPMTSIDPMTLTYD